MTWSVSSSICPAAGVPTLPDEIAPSLITRIREAAQSRDIEIAAVSGTYNMIHPDQEVRQKGLRRLRILAAACQGLEYNGHYAVYRHTRSRRYVALASRERISPGMVRSLTPMEAALRIAEEEQVTLAFEPERANVVSTAARAMPCLPRCSPHV